MAHIYAETGGALPIIGVGGILDPSDATRLFDAGASLVQIYTGLIYRGPGLVRRTNRHLASRADDFNELEDFDERARTPHEQPTFRNPAPGRDDRARPPLRRDRPARAPAGGLGPAG